MRKTIYRLLALLLDTVIVSLIAYALGFVTLFNPTKKDNIEKFDDYSELVTEYLDLTTSSKHSFDNYLEDRLLDEGEVKEIKDKYPIFYDFTTLDGYEPLNEIDRKLENKMDKYIDDTFEEKTKEFSYNLAYTSRFKSIINIVVILLYFGLIQYLLKGQTLFKKVFKLKVVSTTDKEVSLVSYLIRAVLVGELLFKATDTVLLFTLKQNAYLTSTYWIEEVLMVYELAFLVVLLIRDDGRSIHDLLLNTKVIRMDKEGNEIEETFFNKKEEVVEEVKDTTKKNTKKSNKKEYIEAEKVNEKDTNKDN